MDLKFNCEFNATEQGYLVPIVNSVNLHWGSSAFYHTDWFWSLLLDTWLRYVLVIIENSIYFLGDYIFTDMMTHPLAELLNYYYIPITLPHIAPGQHGGAHFNLDVR